MDSGWVLTVKTSLPNVCAGSADLVTTTETFENFVSGRDALRERIKEYAFTENSMFDGKGNIIHFQKYIDDAWVLDENEADRSFDWINDEDCEDDIVYMLQKKNFEYIAQVLRKVFLGHDNDIRWPFKKSEDLYIGIDYKDDEIYIHGADEGPINGYNPIIKTNIFSMREEKEYYLYIDDMFRQDISSELYIDLKKVKVN